MSMTKEKPPEFEMPVVDGVALDAAALAALEAGAAFWRPGTGRRTDKRSSEERALARRRFETARWEFIRRVRILRERGYRTAHISRLSGVGESQVRAWETQVAAAERAAAALANLPEQRS
jgi:hypothetical protein